MRQGTTITYIYGSLPVFTHDIDNLASFRMITSQLHVNGSASQAELCRAFGVCKIGMVRNVKHQKKGMAGFFCIPCLSWASGVDVCGAEAGAATP